MRAEGLTLATLGAIDIPSGVSLPVKHEEGNMFILTRGNGRPTLFISDGVKWWPAISSADELENGIVNRFTNGNTNVQTPTSYRKKHTTSSDGVLSVVWPAGRFTAPPIVNIQVAIPTINGVFDSTHMYIANIDTCTAIGMSCRVRRALVGSQSMFLGGNVTLFEALTAAVDVHISANSASD